MDDSKGELKSKLDTKISTDLRRVNSAPRDEGDTSGDISVEASLDSADGDVRFTLRRSLLVMTCTAAMILNVSSHGHF